MRIETPSIHSLKRLESSHSYLNHERIIIKRDLYLTFRSSVHPSSKGRRVKGFSERRKKLLRWSNNDVALIKKKKIRDELHDSFPLYYNSKAIAGEGSGSWHSWTHADPCLVVRVVKTTSNGFSPPISFAILGKITRDIYDSIVERIFQANLACNGNHD